ncbi:MAG: signal peptidase I [Candidatus Doudnabacteria bacterium]|nr:signal peptidase I [Candidatus Doudnabacteria bacterium]
MDENTNKNQDSGSSSMQAVGSFIWDLVKILVIALIIIVPFRMFVAEPFVVSGSSMLPNFQNGNYLIVDRLSYITGNPQRGDVMVMIYPKDTSQFFIKRIIGLPGETIELPPAGSPNFGHVVIFNQQNPAGFVLPESYLPAGTPTYGSPQKVTLSTGEYFVLGDNRTASSDSRVWGILPRTDIVGKVWLRIFPFSDFGFFHTPSYQQ